nr:uncharacterized protein LOC129057915 [Pongo abelii]
MELPESQTSVIVIVHQTGLPGFGLVLGNVCKESHDVVFLWVLQLWIPGPYPVEVAGEGHQGSGGKLAVTGLTQLPCSWPIGPVSFLQCPTNSTEIISRQQVPQWKFVFKERLFPLTLWELSFSAVPPSLQQQASSFEESVNSFGYPSMFPQWFLGHNFTMQCAQDRAATHLTNTSAIMGFLLNGLCPIEHKTVKLEAKHDLDQP